MGIAVEIFLDKEWDEETFERMAKECGYFEEKTLHEVLFALTYDGEALRSESEIQALGIEDLTALNGTLEDYDDPEMLMWGDPLRVAAAADRLAGHLQNRDTRVAFVAKQLEERFSDMDGEAQTMDLEFRPGEGSWAVAEQEVRALAKVARWVAAAGHPRMAFVQV